MLTNEVPLSPKVSFLVPGVPQDIPGSSHCFPVVYGVLGLFLFSAVGLVAYVTWLCQQHVSRHMFPLALSSLSRHHHVSQIGAVPLA